MSKAQGIAQSANQGQFKNRILNGGMQIDQRNNGASVTLSASQNNFIVDRWRVGNNTDGSVTVQRSTVAPTGFVNSLLVTVGTADTSIGASQSFYVQQPVEGVNVSDLSFGSSGAYSVSVGFWVRSSLTGLYSGTLTNSAENRLCPLSFTINSANTWEYKSISVSGDTTGTWLTDTGAGLKLYVFLAVGSNLQGGTNGTWNGSSYTPSSVVNFMGTVGNTFYITGVQLEKGSTATSFDYRPYGTELALCQRYFERMVNTSSTSYSNGGIHFTNNFRGNCDFRVTKRVTPTFTSSANSTFYVQGNNANPVPSAVTMLSASLNSAYLSATVSSTLGTAASLLDNSDNSFIAFSAEL